MQYDPSTIPNHIISSLSIIDGVDKGKTIRLTKLKTVFGRKRGDEVLNDTKISSSHFYIEFINGNFFLYDMGSTNGTFLNRKKIRESILKNLDEIQIGFTTLIFYFQDSRTLNLSSNISQHRGGSGGEDDSTSLQEAKTRKISDLKELLSNELGTMRRDIPKKNVPPNPIQQEASVTERYDDINNEEQSPSQLFNQMRQSMTTHKAVIYIEVKKGNDTGKKYTFDKSSMVIGRINADINVQDTDVSRKHALIETLGKDQIYVRDLASTNGTFVNGRRITNCRLNNWDEIRVGRTIMQFIIEDESK